MTSLKHPSLYLLKFVSHFSYFLNNLKLLKQSCFFGTFPTEFYFSYLNITFPIEGLSFLHSEIILHFAELCYAFEEKKTFCYHYHNLMKQGHSKLLSK